MFQFNKLLSKREEQQNKSRHDLKIKSTKSSINSHSPLSSSSRPTNAKKIQMLEDKCTEIERENRILYEKMLKIKNKPHATNKTPPIRSLNKLNRKYRMQEILNANSQLSARIYRKQSCYALDKFNAERKETEKILSTISEFPLLVRRNKKHKTSCSYMKKSQNSQIGGNLLYKQGKVLGGRSYLMEVFRNSDNFRIVGFDLEKSEKNMIHLLPSEVEEYCGGEFDGKKLLDKVDVVDGNMVMMVC